MQNTAIRWWDSPAMALLGATVFVASMRLAVTRWIPSLNLVEIISVYGLILGLALGWSHLRKLSVILLTLGYSIVAIAWQLVRAVDDPMLIAAEQVEELSERLSLTFSQFSHGEPIADTIFFLSLMLVAFWFISLYSGFVFARYRNTLAAILPSLIAVLLIQALDNRPLTHLSMSGYYFFFALLLIGRINYLDNHKVWIEKRVFITPEIGLDFNVLVFGTITLVMLLAWNIPASRAEWDDARQWWQDTTEALKSDRLDNALSAVDNAPPAKSGVLYGTQLNLGQFTYQGREEMLVVQPPKLQGSTVPPRYYWRMRSYDTYLNGGWSQSPELSQHALPAMTEFDTPDLDIRFTGEFIFINKAETQTVYVTAAQPLWVSEPSVAFYTPLPNNELDINHLRAETTLTSEDAYAVRSALVAPTMAELRQAGADYPDWVTARYLQLPDDLPESIRDLSLHLANGQDTPYDITRAITIYLRSEITYSSNVPATPRGKDPLEWFLFEWKQGYCNYAATAEVVMLRAAGIPARMVVGFSQGDRDANGNFIVKQRDAHAWPEVYFPEIGWVEFEPTGNQSRLVRPLGERIEEDDELAFGPGGVRPNDERDEFLDEGLGEDFVPPVSTSRVSRSPSGTFLFWGIITFVTGSAGAGIWYLNRKQALVPRALRVVVQVYEKNDWSAPKWLINWSRWSEITSLERAFHIVNVGLRRLGTPAETHLTPVERAEALIALLPEEKEAITMLLREHQNTLYTPDTGDAKIAHQARRSVWLGILKKKLRYS